MCSVTRYAGYFKGRILTGPGNFAHGHYGGYVGVAEYGYTLMSDWRNKSLAFDTDWLIFCGQNAAPWRFFANGQSVGIVDSEPPMRTESRLGVNHCEYWNGWYCDYLNTDFGIMEIAIWNRTLSQDEILTMHMFYSDMLAHGNTAAVNSGASSCTMCVPGTYFYPAGGSPDCALCLPGSFSSTAGASACTPCFAGTYYNSTGATACTPCVCEAGTFSTAVGASACSQCYRNASGPPPSLPPPLPGNGPCELPDLTWEVRLWPCIVLYL